MQNKNKIICLLVVTLFSFFSFTQEQKKDPIEVDNLEAPKDLKQGYNYPYQISVNHSWKTYATVSFIYWQGKELGTELATERQLNTEKLAKVIQIKQDFHPGFKLGAGVRTDFDNWDVYFEYLRIHFSNHRSKIAQENSYLNPIWMDSENFEGAGNAKGVWKVKLDLAEFAIKRACYVGKQFFLEPKAGIKAGTIKQRYTATYHYSENSNLLLDSNNRSTSWLIGPVIGTSSICLLGKGFNLFLIGDIAVFYQGAKARTRQDYTETELFRNSKKKFSLAIPNVDLSSGFDWNTYFDRGNWHLRTIFSYDFSIFFNQNFMRYLKDNISTRNNGDSGKLSFQGLEITLRLDF